jgi:hypothetical protein
MVMRKLFLFAAMFMFVATSCDSEVNNSDNNGATESRVTEEVMDVLINDLLTGVFNPYDCEVMDGDKCVKPWGEAIFGTIGYKFADFGLGDTIVFYNDGTCRMGYTSGLYSHCEEVLKDENHPKALYDTWQWSYNKAEATITIIAEDLSKGKNPKSTIKVVAYKDGILMIDGELPNGYLRESSYKYKCIVKGAEARAEFEEVYFNEEDYPCCAQ